MRGEEDYLVFYPIILKDGKFISTGTGYSLVFYLGEVRYHTKRNGEKIVKVWKKIADELDRFGISKLKLKVDGNEVTGIYQEGFITFTFDTDKETLDVVILEAKE